MKLTHEQEAEILRMRFACGTPAAMVVEIVRYWNAGHSANHIAEILGLKDRKAVNKPLASIRTRTDLPLRRVVTTVKAPAEHPSWWTPERVARFRDMFYETEMSCRAISERMQTSEVTIKEKAQELGWERIRVTQRKDRSARSAIDKQPGPAPAPLKLHVCEPLEGTQPKPFYQVALRGECNWILADSPGSMSDALTCAAETKAGEKYCPHHMGLGLNPGAYGKPLSAKGLVRRYGSYA